MRTTVDIHSDLDAQLRQRASELGITFKEALNRALATGLKQAWEAPAKPFHVVAKPCGLKAGFDWNHLNRLADELEDESRFS